MMSRKTLKDIKAKKTLNTLDDFVEGNYKLDKMAKKTELESPTLQSQMAAVLEKLESLDQINKKLDLLTVDISSVKEDVAKHETEIKDIKDSMDFTDAEVRDLKKQVEDLKQEQAQLNMWKYRQDALFFENKKINGKMIDMDSKLRRNNLVFYGIKEDPDEVCSDVLFNIFEKKLKLHDSRSTVKFVRVHRLGAAIDLPKTKDTKSVRPILAVFVKYADLMKIYSKRDMLKGKDSKSSIAVSLDFPEEIQKVRSQLKLVLKQAKRVDENAHITRDKLVFRGKLYSLAECYKIDDLNVHDIGHKELSDKLLFHGRFCPLSNFYPSIFELHGQTFKSAEQSYQYFRAEVSGKFVLSQQIMLSQDPVEAKQLAKSLDVECSEETGMQIMKDVLHAKFSQDEIPKMFLKSTGVKKLIECNKYDAYWGNGMALKQRGASGGKGENKLGLCLEELRKDLF